MITVGDSLEAAWSLFPSLSTGLDWYCRVRQPPHDPFQVGEPLVGPPQRLHAHLQLLPQLLLHLHPSHSMVMQVKLMMLPYRMCSHAHRALQPSLCHLSKSVSFFQL